MSKTIMILPTMRCDQKCAYCYVDSKYNEVIPTHFIKYLYDEISEFVDSNGEKDITFLWHGGEPTLVNIEYWKLFDELQKENNFINIRNSVQSNLVNNKPVIEWMINNDFKISCSLDGQFDIHSVTRNLTQKKYNQLLTNLSIVKKYQDKVGVICVVTQHQIKTEICSLLSFYEQLGVDVKFNIVFADDYKDSVTYAEYFTFLKSIAKIWLNKPESTINIEPIATDFAALFGDKSKSSCDRNYNCFENFITIDNTGNCYPCNRFVNDKNWMLGNISDFSLQEYWQNSKEMLHDRIKYLETCKTCDYLFFCGGGCKYQHMNENAETLTDFCNSFQDYIEFLRQLYHDKSSEISNKDE